MGLFDKFRRKVKTIAEETDAEELTEESPVEPLSPSPLIQNELKPIQNELKEIEVIETPPSEWDEWESESVEEPEDPWKKLSKKERKKLKKEAKKANKVQKQSTKPKGSKVDLQMIMDW